MIAEDIADRGGIGRLVALMAEHGFWLPVIATAADADPRRVVEAIKSGALDYLVLPLDRERLLATLRHAEDEAQALGLVQRQAVEARAKLAALTTREGEVLDLLVAGSSNKMIARELQISPRTVEIHRANMMTKLGAHHAADAVRLRLEAAMGSGPRHAAAGGGTGGGLTSQRPLSGRSSRCRARRGDGRRGRRCSPGPAPSRNACRRWHGRCGGRRVPAPRRRSTTS